MVRIRSGYSFRSATGKIENVMKRILECKYPAAPITDRASTFGYVRWQKLCKQNNIKPVYGVEIAVTGKEQLKERKNSTDYWTFIAINDVAAVNRLVALATEQFYYEALLSYEQAAQAEGVVKIAGYRSDLTKFKPQPDIYISLAPSCSKGYISKALSLGHQLAACSDNKWTNNTLEDQILYETIVGREASLQSYPQFILDDSQWFDSIQYSCSREQAEQALANSKLILKYSNASLKKARMVVPEKPLSLRDMCIAGAAKLNCDLSDPVYEARLNRELSLIEEKGYEDYFYIISDLCRWSRERFPVGPARGSSAGSLVCYLLEITTVNPIPYRLLYERFVDIHREDMPDIDLDFADSKRHLALEYLEEKYGNDKVFRIGSVALYKGPSALNEAGAALKIPKWKCDAVADSLLKRSGGDARALDTLEDTFKMMPAGQVLISDHPEMKIVSKMEGHPRHSSQHAAGVVITNEPTINYVAIDSHVGAMQCDKKDAEELNLLKIDCLGLTQLSTFEYALELAGLSIDTLNKIPLDDKLAFKVLNDAHFCGIFQFNGMALQSICKQFKTECLEDIVAITALARPGPLASGGAHEWVRRKNGVKPVTYPHPVFEPYLSETLGITIYQEQVMEIGRNVGGLSWEDVTQLRKAMSKSLGVEYFDQFGDRFKANARQYINDDKELYNIWRDLCSMGSWCLDGDTEIRIAERGGNIKKNITIKELYEKYELNPSAWIRQRKSKPILVSLFPEGKGFPQTAFKILKSGQKHCWKFCFEDSSFVICTKEHKFIVNGEWKAIGDASVGDSFSTLLYEKTEYIKTGEGHGHCKGKRYKTAQEGFPDGDSNPSWKTGTTFYANQFKEKHSGDPCQDCGEIKKRMEAHHNDFNHGLDDPKDLVWLCAGCHKKRHYANGRKKRWSKGLAQGSKKLVSFEYFGIKETYDISMPEHHNFVLENNLITHNSFNKSHAVSYGIISYQCAWLKAHHPFEFAAATLTNESDPDKQILLLREMVQEGYDYISVDPNLSTDKWTVGLVNGRKCLIGPFTNIKGIGPKTIEKILAARKNNTEIPKSVVKLMEAANNRLGSLFPISDAFKRLLPDPVQKGIFEKPINIKDIDIRSKDYTVTVFCTLKKINPRDENEAINVAKRGGQVIVGEPTASLNLQLTDDTDTIFGKVSRWDYDVLAKPIVDRGRTGKCLYAIQGKVKGGRSTSFRMIKIERVTYVGDITDGLEKPKKDKAKEEKPEEQLRLL